MAVCKDYEALEQAFIDVRTRNRMEFVNIFRDDTPEAELRKIIERHSREELRALGTHQPRYRTRMPTINARLGHYRNFSPTNEFNNSK